jgi:electron transfer flavoprotein beta subunit
MKIAVCVKHVPGGHLRIEPGSGRLDRSTPGELNRVDKTAVEEALRLKEGGSAHEVVAVSVGPEEAVESLRTVLGMGADRAVLVSDSSIGGSDVIATAIVLARALEREAADLVLFGQQTSDGGGGLLWAAVGELLVRPYVSQAGQLSVESDRVTINRQTEYGDEVIEASLPLLVSVTDSINEPRYTSLKGMMGAKRKPLDMLSLSDLGIEATRAGDAGSKTEVVSVGAPPSRAEAKRIDDEGRAPQEILDFLVEKELL